MERECAKHFPDGYCPHCGAETLPPLAVRKIVRDDFEKTVQLQLMVRTILEEGSTSRSGFYPMTGERL